MTVIEWIILVLILGWVFNAVKFYRREGSRHPMFLPTVGLTVLFSVILILSLIFNWSGA